MQYRRSKARGAEYFFTVNLADRTSDLLLKNIDILRKVMRTTRQRHPFEIVAMVVLPEHIHALWRLPPSDADFPLRWSLIKAGFSRAIDHGEPRNESRRRKRERGLWQRRYWEHRIRDEQDRRQHVAYIHFNPVKHGQVDRAVDWPYSSIHRAIERGWLTADWGSGQGSNSGNFGEREA